MKKSKTLGLLLAGFMILSLSHCENILPHKDDSLSKKIQDYLVAAYFSGTNHALYKFSTLVPLPDPNTIGPLYFQDPFFQRDNSKTKIVFIHGWDFTERQSDPPTDFNRKVANLLGTWNQALSFATTRTPPGYSATVYNTFEIYVFTYRTSDYIGINGRRFIDTLNIYFSNADKVIVVAHSMGGLVSRAAILDANNNLDVIDHIVSLGTPYYGSPFSSPQYQANLSSIGSIIGFMTDTPGGQGLAYTNGGFTANVSALSDPIIKNSVPAYNAYLEELIGNHTKDTQTTAYAGDISGASACTAGSMHDATYAGGCLILTGNTPPFNDSDGIVTLQSARLNGYVTANSVSNLDHSQMSFRDPSGNNTTAVQNHFDSVFQYINGL
ncbi:esterase/lipase family protein [Leptospira wolffii]|uniref:Esterase/lipase family protein n=1 Tax=Leptospira wolffii TaxID=409998 RepID=A0ABV5BLT4_9LEPT|nr:alpha/beta hydrolase [Leptospira wolffii]TGL49978.1 alpha/beta hydrolase [Leptospira wolffii]